MHELCAALADNKARNDPLCVDLLRSIKACFAACSQSRMLRGC